MTDASAVFRRLGTMGWLALAGSPPTLNQSGAQIAERLLEVADLSRPPVLLSPEDHTSSELGAFLEDLEILLGVEIQVIDPLGLNDEELQSLWLNAGVMIMAGGTQDAWFELITTRLFKIKPQEILAEGTILFTFGVPAGLMGAWMLNPQLGELDNGLGWIMGGVVLPTNRDPAEIAAVRNHLEVHEGGFALGLPDGALLAFGPGEQVEVWTEKAPVLLLGRGWQE